MRRMIAAMTNGWNVMDRGTLSKKVWEYHVEKLAGISYSGVFAWLTRGVVLKDGFARDARFFVVTNDIWTDGSGCTWMAILFIYIESSTKGWRTRIICADFVEITSRKTSEMRREILEYGPLSLSLPAFSFLKLMLSQKGIE
jgi:hypothetical protein